MLQYDFDSYRCSEYDDTSGDDILLILKRKEALCIAPIISGTAPR
jgi:hypothetical protein